MPLAQAFVTSPSLAIYKRDGSPLEAPLDSPVPRPTSLIIHGSDSESVKDFNVPVLLEDSERLRPSAQITAFAQIVIGGFHRVSFTPY
jgi:hypothetical protein